MRRFCLALALVAAIPLSARAEPITVDLQSSSNAGYSGSANMGWFSVDIGEIVMSGTNSTAVFFIDGLKHGSDYTVGLNISNASGLENLRFEVLDPLDGDDAWDPGAAGVRAVGILDVEPIRRHQLRPGLRSRAKREVRGRQYLRRRG